MAMHVSNVVDIVGAQLTWTQLNLLRTAHRYRIKRPCRGVTELRTEHSRWLHGLSHSDDSDDSDDKLAECSTNHTQADSMQCKVLQEMENGMLTSLQAAAIEVHHKCNVALIASVLMCLQRRCLLVSKIQARIVHSLPAV